MLQSFATAQGHVCFLIKEPRLLILGVEATNHIGSLVPISLLQSPLFLLPACSNHPLFQSPFPVTICCNHHLFNHPLQSTYCSNHQRCNHHCCNLIVAILFNHRLCNHHCSCYQLFNHHCSNLSVPVTSCSCYHLLQSPLQSPVLQSHCSCYCVPTTGIAITTCSCYQLFLLPCSVTHLQRPVQAFPC